MKKYNKINKLLLLIVQVALCVAVVRPACAGSEAFALCAKKFTGNDAERLKCFDAALATPAVASVPAYVVPVASVPVTPARAQEDEASSMQTIFNPNERTSPSANRSYLTRVWNLDNRPHRDPSSLDRLQPHRQSYLIVRKTTNGNNQPTSPAPNHSVLTPYDMDAIEGKFYLSFKSDIVTLENLDLWGLKTMRLWGAYSQQSHWQVFNTRNSSPFRETNYEPELIAAFGTGNDNGWKMLNLGLEHQSNGRAKPESRSWNRVYVQGGWEWGNTSLLARSWWRIPESAMKDDNPDIVHYIGRAELVARWEPDSKLQAVSMLLRNNLNLSHNIGFMQLDWSMPVPLGRAARLHAQITNGYGESMIDYNQRQTTFGMGVSFREW